MVSRRNLSSIRALANLTEAGRSEIEEKVRWIEYKPNAVILTDKEVSTDIYFLVEGSVRSTIFSASGKEIAYEDLGVGDVFGELSALDRNPRTTSIVSTSPVLLGVLSADDFDNLIIRHPEVMRYIVNRLTVLVRRLIGRVYEYSALDVRSRVRQELLRLSQPDSHNPDSRIIEKLPTHELIANAIATHREAVTKELSYLTNIGVISRDGKRLIIQNGAVLEQMIEQEPDS